MINNQIQEIDIENNQHDFNKKIKDLINQSKTQELRE